MATKPNDQTVPEHATREPEILTPEEDARRATRRLEWEEREHTSRWPQADDPLRQPGEPSPAPEKRK